MEDVVIIGGGVSGLSTAISLSKIGISSTIIERDNILGGKVRKYSKIFPDFRNGLALVESLIHDVNDAKVKIMLNSYVNNIISNNSIFIVNINSDYNLTAKSIVLCCGFETFNPSILPEYGYSKYPNVITSVELEDFLNPLGKTNGDLIRPYDGKIARRIAIIFCVGSRNAKIGNLYCSRVCCSYSIKQAIEIKEKFKDANVVCFYMDIRTYGRNYEEMYKIAQELGVKFIRGRVAECSMLNNGDIQIRAENTLLGKPMQGIFDMVSLSIGMMPFKETNKFSFSTGLKIGSDGFIMSLDDYFHPFDTTARGLFVCGTITGLKPIRDCLADANGVSLRVKQYIDDLKY